MTYKKVQRLHFSLSVIHATKIIIGELLLVLNRDIVLAKLSILNYLSLYLLHIFELTLLVQIQNAQI